VAAILRFPMPEIDQEEEEEDDEGDSDEDENEGLNSGLGDLSLEAIGM
jgi:hypothetical protein